MFETLFKRREKTPLMQDLAHDTYFENLRQKEYARLDADGHVYLDYTGGNLYGKSQIEQHTHDLTLDTYGNPHSTNPTSQLATNRVEAARKKVLDFFHADDYYCVFTANASGALKIVGECFPFNAKSHFVLLADNHNSVNGIREYATGKGSGFEYVPVSYEDLTISPDVLESALSKPVEGDKLFAFPAQSNVSGVKHDLNWIAKAQEKGWNVLLDAAAFVPSNPLCLNEVRPDFVSVSFYKIFGYPTGLGCLLVRKDKFNVLKKQWFAGGTVTLAGVKSPSHYLAGNHERYENGTIDYLGIPALKIGLDYIESIGIHKIQERVASMSQYLCDSLRAIKHDSGQCVVNLFGPENRASVGGTLIMTFNNADGSIVPFATIESMTNERMISIRSGCFCNPGLDEINNCLSTDELSGYFVSRDQGDYRDMMSALQKMRGAIRVSVGLATVKKDLDIFLDFVRSLCNKNC